MLNEKGQRQEMSADPFVLWETLFALFETFSGESPSDFIV